MTEFQLMELFPAFGDPSELDTKQIALVQLCAKIGVPFPAETNKSYGNWWHSLHEIAHWAVKPQWYVQYAQYLVDDLAQTWGSLHIPAGTVPGVDHEVRIERLGRYVGGNDVIPDIGLYSDPTPAEQEVRCWSLQFLERMQWPHPFDDNVERVTTGDHFFHKAASARVWATPLKDSRRIAGHLRRWGIDVRNGRYRPYPMIDNIPFALPYPRPCSHKQMIRNMDAILACCVKTPLTTELRRYWLNDFMLRRWPNDDLAARFQATESI